MYKILVLTDFSEAATNAASYACVIARQLNCQRLLFYHAYQNVIEATENVQLQADEKGPHTEAMNKLQDLGNSLREMVPEGTTLHFRADPLGLHQIAMLAEEEDAELIVMGTTGKSKIEKMLVGSHAELVCKMSQVPVVLVPPHIEMDPIQHIVFACDLKEVADTLPLGMIQKMLNAFHVPLSVINVNMKENLFADSESADLEVLNELLQRHAPDYHDIDHHEPATGILQFATIHKASLILLVARKRNFTEGLFHRSVTSQLTYDTPIPLLILHEKEKE